jgi:hypothetical protein
MAWTLARASSEAVSTGRRTALRWGVRTPKSCAAIRLAIEPRCSDDFAGTHCRRLTRAPDADRAIDQAGEGRFTWYYVALHFRVWNNLPSDTSRRLASGSLAQLPLQWLHPSRRIAEPVIGRAFARPVGDALRG